MRYHALPLKIASSFGFQAVKKPTQKVQLHDNLILVPHNQRSRDLCCRETDQDLHLQIIPVCKDVSDPIVQLLRDMRDRPACLQQRTDLIRRQEPYEVRPDGAV